MKVTKFVVLLVVITLLGSLHSVEAHSSPMLRVLEADNVVTVIEISSKKVINTFDYSQASNLSVIQTELVYPHLCILLKDNAKNEFLAETYYYDYNLKLIDKHTFNDLKISNESLNFAFIDDKNCKNDLDCSFSLHKTKLSFCLWDRNNANYIHPFNYRFNSNDSSTGGDWSGYGDSYRDKKIVIDDNRIIYGFQQSGVELTKKNGIWILSRIFAPEVPYCEFSHNITYTDNLLIVCLGVCCVKNESLVAIYELDENNWSEPQILGIDGLPERTHLLADFVSYKDGILAISYGVKGLRNYSKENGKWVQMNRYLK